MKLLMKWDVEGFRRGRFGGEDEKWGWDVLRLRY